MQRFLIIKLLIKKLIITNAGIAPSGTTGLRKPPGSLLPACLYLCLHQCGLLKHVTCLKKMQFPKWDSAFSLWMRRESSRNAITLHPHASVGRCQLHAASVRARCYCEATSEQWTQKRFQTWEKGGLTRIGKQNHRSTPSGIGGAGAKALRAHTQETIVWENM